MLVDEIESKRFELLESPIKEVLYDIERAIGNAFFKKRPPSMRTSPQLLNLGCGPLKYDGWCNADDYAFKRFFRDKSFAPDWRLDITEPWRCDDDHWDGIFSQHVVEHVRYSKAIVVLRECFRTLKPGAWLRITVPTLSRYVDFYKEGIGAPEFTQFPQKAFAFSYMAQMHYHKSIWDPPLMTALLVELGFTQVKEVPFGEGTDTRLIKDQDAKEWESLYVEARKPNRCEGMAS